MFCGLKIPVHPPYFHPSKLNGFVERSYLTLVRIVKQKEDETKGSEENYELGGKRPGSSPNSVLTRLSKFNQ